MKTPAISARGVTKYFGDFPAIRRLSLDVEAGSILALLGRNGAGKTTLLQMFAGLSQPTSGEIRLSGSRTGLARQTGVVGHGLWLYEELTAEENLAFFGSLYRVADLPAKIDHWLEQAGLTRFRHARLQQFSRGMRQRLAIARAFLHEPEILLLDEPWTALDDRAIVFLSELIQNAHRSGRTIVVCSHQLREALEIATEVVLLDRGRLAFQAPKTPDLTPDSLYGRIS